MFTILDLFNIFLPLFVLLSFALYPYELQKWSIHVYFMFVIAIVQMLGEFLYPFEYHISDYCIAVSHTLCWIIICFLYHSRPRKFALSGVFSLFMQHTFNTTLEFMTITNYSGSNLFKYRMAVIAGELVCIFIISNSMPKGHSYVYDSIPESSRELNATFWQSLTFSWFNDLIKKGYEKYLALEDIWDLTHQDSSKLNFEKFQKIRQLHPDNLRDSLIILVWPVLCRQACFALVSALLSFSGPFFLNLIVRFVEKPDSDSHISYAAAFAFGLFFCSISRACADGQTYFLGGIFCALLLNSKVEE